MASKSLRKQEERTLITLLDKQGREIHDLDYIIDLWLKSYVFVQPDGGHLRFMAQNDVIASN